MIKVELSDAECRYIQELVSREVKRLEPKINAECSNANRNRYHCASGISTMLSNIKKIKLYQDGMNMSSQGENPDFDQIPEELLPDEFVVENSEGWELAIINKMKRDAIEKIGFDPANMSRDETRHLVSSFYAIQDQRIAVAGRSRGLEKNGTPTAMLDFAMGGFLNTEET